MEQVYNLTLDLEAFCRINNIDLQSLFKEEIIPEMGLQPDEPDEYDGFLMTLKKSKDKAIKDLKGYCERHPLPIPIEF